MVGQRGLHCLPATFPASAHGRRKTALPEKRPSKHAKQRPSHADAVILCPLIFLSQLAFILRFVNSMQIPDREKEHQTQSQPEYFYRPA